MKKRTISSKFERLTGSVGTAKSKGATGRLGSKEEQEKNEPWNWEKIPGVKDRLSRIGKEISNARDRKKWTLQQLSEQIAQYHPSNRTITPSQLSKIERGEVSPALHDLELVCLAFGMDLGELLTPAPRPWFVIRESQIDRWFEDLKESRRSNTRPPGWHSDQVESHTYYYVPLESYEVGLIRPGDRSGTMSKTLMRANMLWIRGENPGLEIIENALVSHRGEELMLVLEGDVNFWHATPEGRLDRNVVCLKPGDCLRFSSELGHVFYGAVHNSSYAKVFHVFSDPVYTEPTVTTHREQSQA